MVHKTWLRFIEEESRPKTKVFSVHSIYSNDRLGEIRWYPQWRHYCFFPTIDFQAIYSDRCLMELSKFIIKLNDEHKK